MEKESVLALRTFNFAGEDAENCKTSMAVLKNQLNLVDMIKTLPARIKFVDEQLKKNEEKKLKFVESQERGEI